MTKDMAIHYMLHNPNCHVWHPLFADGEYLYSKGDGIIYDEVGNVFEDFESHCAGMRLRWEDVWLTGWRVILGPNPELGAEDPINVLHKLLDDWGIDCHMTTDYKNELVKYLVANGVTIIADE